MAYVRKSHLVDLADVSLLFDYADKLRRDAWRAGGHVAVGLIFHSVDVCTYGSVSRLESLHGCLLT